MVVVAKEIGISDRGLAKAAARIEVPVPPLGYWAKLNWGKAVSRTALPIPKPTTSREIEIDRWPNFRSLRNAPPLREPQLQARIDAARECLYSRGHRYITKPSKKEDTVSDASASAPGSTVESRDFARVEARRGTRNRPDPARLAAPWSKSRMNPFAKWGPLL
jgi:hypothetical protein